MPTPIHLRLISLVVVLALIYSLTSVACSVSFRVASVSIPKLLSLSCGFEVLLLIAYAVLFDSQNAARRRSIGINWLPSPDVPQQSVEVAKDAKVLDAAAQSRSWPLFLLAALLSTAAGNIFLRLLAELRPYAWAQLGLLEVIALAAIIAWCRSGSSCAKAVWGSEGSRVGLALLLAAVCLGHGVVGWAPSLPAVDVDEEDERLLLDFRHNTATAAPHTRPITVVLLAALAAFCAALASHILQQRRHLQPKQRGFQLSAHIKHCGLVLACNLLLYLCTEEEPLDSPFEEITALHWHGMLLLAISSLLSRQLASWPASMQLLSKGYVYQGAVVVTAACSSWLLQTQAVHDVQQVTQFACSGLVAGAAILLLHNSMQHPSGSKAPGPVKQGCPSWRPVLAWPRRQDLLRSLHVCWTRDALLCMWAATAMLLLLMSSRGTSGGSCGPQLSFTYTPSKAAMAELGITPQLLSARSDAPFPGSVLLASKGWAAWQAVNSAPTAAGAPKLPTRHAAGALGTSVPAWSLCPALTCSKDPTCTPGDPACCVHLLQHMMAFWDAFMHGLGLSQHYLLLHDTLADAAYRGTLRANASTIYMGISAAAVTVLERPCIKEALWRHGYVLFMQDSSWRLCAHREHPINIFRQHMHPARHLTAATAANYLNLDVMWPYVPQDVQPANKTYTVLASMQEAASRRLVSGLAPKSHWWLCSTNELLASAAENTAALSGLQLPQPVDNMQHLSPVSPSNSSGGAPAHAHDQAVCQQLVAELLARMEW